MVEQLIGRERLRGGANPMCSPEDFARKGKPDKGKFALKSKFRTIRKYAMKS